MKRESNAIRKAVTTVDKGGELSRQASLDLVQSDSDFDEWDVSDKEETDNVVIWLMKERCLFKKCEMSFKREQELRSLRIFCKICPDSMYLDTQECKLTMQLITNNEIVVFQKAADDPALGEIKVANEKKTKRKFDEYCSIWTESGYRLLEEALIATYMTDGMALIRRGLSDKEKKLSQVQIKEQLQARLFLALQRTEYAWHNNRSNEL